MSDLILEILRLSPDEVPQLPAYIPLEAWQPHGGTFAFLSLFTLTCKQDTYPNGGFDQEESSFLNMGVTYPVQMRWMLGEYADEVKEQKTREGKRNKVLEAIGLGLLATVILLPIFVVAGPPVGTYRGVKKIGRGVKRIASRKTRTSSADNVEEAEATAK